MWNNYTMLTVILQYLGPLIVISITYGLIAKVIWVISPTCLQQNLFPSNFVTTNVIRENTPKKSKQIYNRYLCLIAPFYDVRKKLRIQT